MKFSVPEYKECSIEEIMGYIEGTPEVEVHSVLPKKEKIEGMDTVSKIPGEGESKNMCNLSDLIVEQTEKRVTEEVAAKEMVQSVTNLMANLQWSLEKACEALGKTVEEFQAAKQVVNSIRE